MLSDQELTATAARIKQLRQSDIVVDNVKAILIDGAIGDLGLYESIARDKAFAILNLLRNRAISAH